MYAALSAALCTVATSCDSDDDGNEGGGSVVPPTEASNFGGERLTSAGDVTFIYNSDGSLRQVNDGGSKIVFDYSKGLVTFTEGDFTQQTRFTTNDKGYITSLSGSGTENDGESKYQWELSYQFKYNGNGHLISVITNETDTYMNTGEKETTDITCDILWNGNLISTVETTGTYKGNGESEKWSKLSDYTYTDAPDNCYKQYTSAIMNAIDIDGDIEAPMLAGIMGKGPSKYPVIITSRNDANEVSTLEISYDLNSKGLVTTENCLYHDEYGEYDWSVSYGYGSASKVASRSNGKSVDKIIRHGNPRNHVSLFKRMK